ncbi:MAG: Gfo/Idh/MocA family oxidoreductase [Clostridiales bacterium]|nr:Gfo/Idh/MocA family oxidoreductase [Clostridiales bacterium]
MREIGVGIIGWGFMGRAHANALRALPLFYPGVGFVPRIVALCTRNRAAAADAAERLGIPFVTADYRTLLARTDVEVVSICTPNDLHEVMALDAIAAGKRVYIDKPLADTVEGADRIADAAASSGAITQLALQNRFFPATMRAKQLIDEGAIGEILSFQCRYLHSGSIDPNRPIGWKQTAQAGVLLDLGSHALDLITWLIGMPQSLCCAMRTLYSARPTREGGVETALSDDHALITLRMPSGALGTVEASKIATGTLDELSLEILGDRGGLRWQVMEPGYLEFYDNTLPEGPLGGRRGYTRIECGGKYPPPGGAFLPAKSAVGWERSHLHSYYCFLDAVAHGRAASPSVAEGAALQRLLALAATSAAEGRWVDACWQGGQ